MDFSAEIYKIREGGLSSNIIKSILKKFEPRQKKMLLLYERYKTSQSGVPIYSRYFSDKTKVNNKVNNDFFSEIIDLKVGYFAGNPFSYQYDRTKSEYETALDRIQRFALLNNLADLDSETTKMAAICGYGGRLLYIDPEGRERVLNVPAYETIILSEEGLSAPEYGIRIYTVETDKGARRKVEFYDSRNCEVWLEEKKNVFVEDVEESFEHDWGICPLYAVPNNEELLGDVEKVEDLIDAYDRTLSDVNSEIESFRLAYMLFKGGLVDEDTIRQAQRTGAFTVPDDGDISFLTKQMDDDIVENHLTRLHKNIYRFSKTPDLNDEAFAGNQSGVALKYKLFPLESKCTTFERKFTSSQMYLFTALCNTWGIRGETFDPLSFFVEYKRNFPLDLLHEAEVQEKIRGLVSEQTRLALASFIDDVQYEIDQMEEETLNAVLPNTNLDDENVNNSNEFVTE